jgi:hypothetical protein
LGDVASRIWSLPHWFNSRFSQNLRVSDDLLYFYLSLNPRTYDASDQPFEASSFRFSILATCNLRIASNGLVPKNQQAFRRN